MPLGTPVVGKFDAAAYDVLEVMVGQKGGLVSLSRMEYGPRILPHTRARFVCSCRGWTSVIFWMGLCASSFAQLPEAMERPPSQPVNFSETIRPLLSDRCFACHGPDEEHRQADLRLDDLPQLLESELGDGAGIIVPGEATASELIRRILSDEAGLVMPPPETNKPLTAEEQQSLVDWVNQGADWEPHWAYKRPERSATPDIHCQSSRRLVRNWIDAYVSDQHRQVDGQFSPLANATTLLRRLTFDLTGLPPSNTQRESFWAVVDDRTGARHDTGNGSLRPRLDPEASDNLHQACDELVEQLLASPRFGERFASYWLDLVRFADTVGYHGDQDHRISPYRDYVIDALNDNKPFDRFTIEQLAGDLVPDANDEQRIATGYNRLLQTSHEGGIQPKEYLAIYQADRVRNVSAVWFGATIGCAQCHDHKYDPFTAKDFYALAAFFADIDEQQHFKLGSNALPTRRPPEAAWYSRQQRQYLKRLETELEQLKQQSDLDVGENERIALLETQLAEARDETRLSMVTVSIEPRPVRLLPRGNWLDDSGPVMQPAIPVFLGQLNSDRQRPTRLDLAQWLTEPHDGYGLFMARVFVNRVWMLLMGAGLSPSVEDFGGQGVPPSHPELLDRLAIELVANDWDIKHLIRSIVRSHTYRQASLETAWHREQDPDNRWLTRQNRFRLPAEMIRDAALQAGGLLVSDVGGASVKPYQPAGYYRHLNFPTREYHASNGADQYRRGVYTHWQRQFLHPMLRAFDAPMREECSAKRPQSNTPLAALVALNDPSFVECARGLASQTLQAIAEEGDGRVPESGMREFGLQYLFETVVSRRPTAQERRALSALLDEALRHYAHNEKSAVKALQVGEAPAITEDPVALAAWSTVARAVLNLNESMTRN